MFNPNIRLPEAQIVGMRMPYLLGLAEGLRVLHVGCVDVMVATERLATGEHLHARLHAVARHLVGLDIDAKGIEQLGEMGYGDLHVVDITSPGWHVAFASQQFDLILASEVVEHLSNPGIFLDEARMLATATGADFVVTVPNAFRVATLRRLRHGVEFVHPDHNYWFSYHTITNLMMKHGWGVTECLLYGHRRNPLPRRRPATTPHGMFARGPRLDFIDRIRLYLRNLPDRLAGLWLLGRSAYHADGIIVRARPTVSGRQ